MPYIERAFAGEATAMPPVRYEPDATIPSVSDVAHRWVQAFIYPVKDADGKIQEVVLVHEDITERREAEEERRRAEEKYRSIFENAVEGIFQTTVEGQFLTANPAMARMFGYDSSGGVAGGHLQHRGPALRGARTQGGIQPARAAGRLRERFRGAVAAQGRNPGVDLGPRPRRLRRGGRRRWLRRHRRGHHRAQAGRGGPERDPGGRAPPHSPRAARRGPAGPGLRPAVDASSKEDAGRRRPTKQTVR